MKVTVELEQEDFNHMYDVVYDITNAEPTNAELQAIWDELPESIKDTAIQWGTSDTVFRDKLYVFLRDKANNL